MKHICIFLFLVALSGCGNNGKSPTASPSPINPQSGGPTDTSAALATGGTTEEPSTTANKKTDRGTGGTSGKSDNGIQANSVAPNDNSPKEISLTSSGNTATGSFTEDGQTIIYVGLFARWNTGDGGQLDGSYDSTHSLFVRCGSDLCQEVPQQQIVYQEYGSCDTAKSDRIMMFKKRRNGSIDPKGVRISIQGHRGIIKEGPNTRVIKLDPATIKRINQANLPRKVATFHVTPVIKSELPAKVSQARFRDKAPATSQTKIEKPPVVIQPPATKEEVKFIALPMHKIPPDTTKKLNNLRAVKNR